ncbi:MAG: hypothetical protein V6Z86_05375 [Hyphomicrobiales bacterium]
MSNEVMKIDTSALPSLEALQEGAASAAAQISAGAGETILRFQRGGEWVYGADSVEVEENSQWAIDPTTIRHGWIRWGEGEVLGEQTVPVTVARPPKPDVPDDGQLDDNGKLRDWSEMFAFRLICMTGEDQGTSVVYSTNSHGGKQAIKDYLTRLTGQVSKGSGEVVAVVELSDSNYTHKKYGKIWKPEFNFLNWLTVDDMNGPGEEEEPPKKSRKRTQKPAAKAAPEEPDEGEDEGEEIVQEEMTEPAPRQRKRRQRQTA